MDETKTISIFCPGPSLAGWLANTPGEPASRITVNRAAGVIEAAWWSALDATSVENCNAIGNPKILTTVMMKRKLLHKVPEAKDRPFENVDEIKPPGLGGIKWIRYSMTVAIGFAASLGAKKIDVYGADWNGEQDYDGVKLVGCQRTEKRWTKEADLFKTIQTALTSVGVELKRIRQE